MPLLLDPSYFRCANWTFAYPVKAMLEGLMQEEVIHIERVFDLQRLPQVGQRHRKSTVFSIEEGGRRHFGIEVDGWPTVRDGAIVTAVFKESGDWHSLVGWVDNQTGEEFFCNSPVSATFVASLGFIFVFWCGFLLLNPWLFSIRERDLWSLMLFSSGLAFAFVRFLILYLRFNEERVALRRIRGSVSLAGRSTNSHVLR